MNIKMEKRMEKEENIMAKIYYLKEYIQSENYAILKNIIIIEMLNLRVK